MQLNKLVSEIPKGIRCQKIVNIVPLDFDCVFLTNM